MRLTITIDMDNAAFEHDKHEAARILKELAGRYLLQSPKFTGCKLLDYNGNTVGSCEVSD